MKVLHINSYYSGSSFYKNLFDRQIKRGLDLDVFVPVPTSFESSNLNLGDYTTISANHNKYDRFLYYLKHKKIYKDILKRYEVKSYSVLHAHSLFSNGYIAMKLKLKFGIPFIVAVRNTDVYTFFKYMIHLRKIGIQILKEANQIIFLSEPYKNLIIEKYVPDKFKKEVYDKSKVIPNGINDFWFNNKIVYKERPKKELKLLYVGAINKNKNVLATIKAIDILIEQGLNISYTIVGNITDETVYNKIKKLPYVSYLRPKEQKELIDIYRSNDILVMPSIHETFGLVYVEAMTQGLPVIYTKGQGFDGQFSDGLVGFSVDCESPEEIQKRIVDILNEYDFFSKNAFMNVNKFNWDYITEKYIFTYENLYK